MAPLLLRGVAALAAAATMRRTGSAQQCLGDTDGVCSGIDDCACCIPSSIGGSWDLDWMVADCNNGAYCHERYGQQGVHP
jgi:hypothetical protein